MAVPRSKLGNHYYQLVDQSNRDDLQRINDYVLADFDILQLCGARRKR